MVQGSGMIQSVDRAARILHELGSGSPTLGVTEIGARLDLAKPTVHGLLRTLEQSGLVSQDVATGRYSLGPRVLQLGNAYLAGSELRSRSMLRAGSLARQVNEAVWVSVLVDDAVMAPVLSQPLHETVSGPRNPAPSGSTPGRSSSGWCRAGRDRR